MWNSKKLDTIRNKLTKNKNLTIILWKNVFAFACNVSLYINCSYRISLTYLLSFLGFGVRHNNQKIKNTYKYIILYLTVFQN